MNSCPIANGVVRISKWKSTGTGQLDTKCIDMVFNPKPKEEIKMKLLTKEARKLLPDLYSQDGDPKAMAYVKFFDPIGSGTWWASEFDGEDRFFGFADLGLGPGCAELGYFSLSELESVAKDRGGLGIERDLHFMPTLMTEVIEETKALGR
jgi:hypothetical protein